MWIKEADIVEMQWLELDRFHDTPRAWPADGAEEDAFCATLKMLGADFYSLPPDFSQRAHLPPRKQFACETLETCLTPDKKSDFVFAWPEPEAIQVSPWQTVRGAREVCYIRKEDVERAEGGGWYNAVDMQERCGVIEKLGGRVCSCGYGCEALVGTDWDGPDGWMVVREGPKAGVLWGCVGGLKGEVREVRSSEIGKYSVHEYGTQHVAIL